MILTVMTKKRPYILLDIDGFQVEAEEGLIMDAEKKDGVQIIRFGDWADVDNTLDRAVSP